MSPKSLLILGLIGFTFWFFVLRPPSASSIASRMTVDIEAGSIVLDEVTYTAQWSDVQTYSGDIRYIGRAYMKHSAYFTNDAIVTTGEYSDPEIVTVTPIRKGNMSWRSPHKKPVGTLVVLHFIPADISVFEDLQKVREGDLVAFTGREELDSKIEGDDGSYVGLAHNNHKFIVLEKVTRAPAQ
jgi:hypothetical protein